MTGRLLSLGFLLTLVACEPAKSSMGDSVASDADGDGVVGMDDCDDGDASIHPGAVEVCDGYDNNCDGAIDEGVQSTWYKDDDGDGHGDAATSQEGCFAPVEYVESSDDCDDTDDGINPDATEVCDGEDNDCDGAVDNDAVDATSWYADADHDGYGSSDYSTSGCDQPAGYVADSADCNDIDDSVSPAADEVCDDVDNDCNGLTDETGASDAPTWYADTDGDGHGDAGSALAACEQPMGYVATADDCDDGSELVSPDATEICDPYDVDEDCDGLADDADDDTSDLLAWYVDADGDGYGGEDAEIVASCDAAVGLADNADDCDDDDVSVSPGADEVCDDGDVDEDCDGMSDDDDTSVTGLVTWYPDEDGDGHGADGRTVAVCDDPGSGYSATDDDCDDGDADISPGEIESCDEDDVDEDCDGRADDADSAATGKSWYYPDMDGDGYGDESVDGIRYCDPPSDYVRDDTDCDDTDATIYPGAVEVDPEVDNDCDGVVATAPVAEASYDSAESTLYTCDPLYLDGSGSSDSDGDSLYYDWELTSAPSDSARTTSDIIEPTDESPVFYPDVDGSYTFSLSVDDGDLSSTSDSFSVSITTRSYNTAPVASAGVDQDDSDTSRCSPVSYGVSYSCGDCADMAFTLDGSGTSDADGDTIDSYAWVITGGDTSYGSLSDEDTETPTLTLSGVPAEYGVDTTVTVEVTLTATDCMGESDTDVVEVTFTCTGS